MQLATPRGGCSWLVRLTTPKGGCSGLVRLTTPRGGCSVLMRLTTPRGGCSGLVRLTTPKGGCSWQARLTTPRGGCSGQTRLTTPRGGCGRGSDRQPRRAGAAGRDSRLSGRVQAHATHNTTGVFGRRQLASHRGEGRKEGPQEARRRATGHRRSDGTTDTTGQCIQSNYARTQEADDADEVHLGGRAR